MNSRRVVVVLCAVALVFAGVRAGLAKPAAEDTSAFAPADAQILSEVLDHSEAMQNSEYLGDTIGPRLTGSPQLKQANDWTAAKFREYGLTNVHLEPWTIAHSWTRGTAHARIVSPTEHPLTIASAGWAPGTAGAVRGSVVYVDIKTDEDFEKYRGKLKGAIVIAQEPASLSPPKPDEPFSEVNRPMQTPPPLKGQPAAPSPFAVMMAVARKRTEFYKQEGVAVVLRDSNKPPGLLNMTGIGGEQFNIGAIPTAFITGEGYRMLYRMQKHGPVQVEIEITNSFSDKPVEVYNTVAEIKGSEKPDEVVILGAHLDSWDLGTGSTDNGTGSMAVLETARVLAKLNLKPKRTIRFVLFTGEEEGLVGSAKYAEAHKDELEKISAVLVHDTGTGRVLTLGLHDNYQDREIVDQVIAPLGALKMLEPTTAREYGTDSLSFDEVGVPGFWCAQEIAEYFKTHHSQSDTFDKVWKDDINQGAQVLAAWAYSTAQLPEMLPRRPVPPIAPAAARLETPKTNPIVETDKKIIEQVKTDADQLKADLTYLTTQIGPRLTGSPQLDRASHWTQEQFKSLGLENAHLESWSIANSWTRGPAAGRIVSPAVHELTLAGAGWSPATNGTVKGEVIGVDAEKIEDLEKYKGKLGGKIVIVTRPREMEPPGNPMLTPFGQSAGPLNHAKNQGNFDNRAYMQMRAALTKMLTEEKALAMLTGSEKMYGLMNMSTASREYQPAAFPAAYVEREDYLLIWRMLDAGTPVQVELNVQSSFSGKPVEVYNTVAEIRGTEKPDEVVILGAHLDSWDLGTGATDNGTGSMAVLEAARALQKLGVKPKRTIRF